MAYYAFKKGLGDAAKLTEPPDSMTDAEAIAGLGKAAEWLKEQFGSLKTPYGSYFRVGRDGGERTWPVGGGTLGVVGMATPRAVNYAPVGKVMVGRGGQTSTQIVVLTNPPKSYAIIPLGESDHKESGHWDDQAEKLFSQGKALRTYFMRPDELTKHVTTTKVLSPARTQ